MKNIDYGYMSRFKLYKQIEVIMCHYDAELKWRLDTKRIDIITAKKMDEKKRLNYLNYLMYINMSLFKFQKVVPIYEDFKNKKVIGNDITNLLMLFFPIILDETSAFQYSLQRFKKDPISSFKLSVSGKQKLEQNIKDFVDSVRTLKETRNFEFHRREIFSFLDSFLNVYVMDEIPRITEMDINNNFVYHHFIPFIRPEYYLKVIA